MQTTEIRMLTDLDKAIPQSLEFNFEEVKAWLEENLKAYKTMVVTEDAIGVSKADKAKIRKISTACLRFRRNASQNMRTTPLPSPRTILSVTRYMAVVDAPMVTTGMQNTIQSRFRMIRSASRDINDQNGES